MLKAFDYHVGFFKFSLLSLLLVACTLDKSERLANETTELSPQYAKGFVIHLVEGVKILTVTRPWDGATNNLTYALLKEGDRIPSISVDQIIHVPVNKMVVTSTTHIPGLDLLNASDRLVGFPQSQYISSATMRARIDQGLVKELGAANGVNIEALITLQPDMVMTYQSGPDRTQLESLSISQIPTLLNADFLEETPLGRAEWIKVFGHLLDKPKLADSVFHQIEQTYLELKNQAHDQPERPKVFSGSLYGGTWYAPGGNSFAAQYIADAGGIYTWGSHAETGSLELSFESVIQKNSQTEFWIGLGGFTSLGDLKSADARYESFNAYHQHKVFNYHKRIGATGGFEYLELGSARPDIVLKDYIKMLHPALLPEYEPYFFQKLN